MRTLTINEMNVVSGGWWPVAGAVLGGVLTYAERADDGDMTTADWVAVGAGAVLGATGGGAIAKLYKEAMKKLTK